MGHHKAKDRIEDAVFCFAMILYERIPANAEHLQLCAAPK
jgi:hypothetical protein